MKHLRMILLIILIVHWSDEFRSNVDNFRVILFANYISNLDSYLDNVTPNDYTIEFGDTIFK